ncbi:MAG: ABC transporter permease, partial [Rhizobiales bacterium]|nr:ABC transporter permease [Hyphomicrobiales bacterium]
MALDASVGLLLAVGMTFLLAAAQLDLSIGANTVMSSVIAAKVIGSIASVESTGSKVVLAGLAAAAAAIVVGTLFGAINGLIVTKLHVNALITTLGTGGIVTGLTLVATNGVNLAGIPVKLQTSFGSGTIGEILPWAMVVAIVVCAVLWFVMRTTRLGSRTLAIGSSREAAERSGISVDWVLIRLFALMGGLAGLAGFLIVCRFGTTNIGGGTEYALAAIAAAVIGGTSLFGGRASIGGSIVGSLLPVVLASGLLVVKVSSFYQQVVVGAILVLAVY